MLTHFSTGPCDRNSVKFELNIPFTNTYEMSSAKWPPFSSGFNVTMPQLNEHSLGGRMN